MQDVIPPRDRSIRNIPVPPGRRGSTRDAREAREREASRPPERIEAADLRESAKDDAGRGKPRGVSRLSMWGGAILSLAALLFFGFSLLFAGATVEVEPRSAQASIDGNFEASPNAPVAGLTYQVITIEREGSEVVKASGEADVERRASGVIIVENDYSKALQRLIKNTRFEAPDGKIYRINESVDVPGQRIEGGKTLPGAVEVTVYADSPGEAYNRGLTDFTIPGFKGDPRYGKFTARSKTPMTGGFVGRERVVSDDELAAARSRIRDSLAGELKGAARAQMPAGFILFDDASVISYTSGENTPQGKGELRVAERGALQGVLFNNRELASFVARNTIGSYDEEIVFLPAVEGLAFAIKGKDSLSFPLERPLSFSLKGEALIVWYIDDATLNDALRGREKAALPTIMAEYPVASFKVSSRPFWSSRLPEDAGRLNIAIAVPTAK